MRLRRFVLCILGLLFVLLPGSFASAYLAPDWEVVGKPTETVPCEEAEGEFAAPSYILMEEETGMIAAGKEIDTLYQPVSLVKMMTALLIAEAVETGQLDLKEEVTASENACNMRGVELWLVPGEKMTVEDLLTAILIGSGNDASVALAEHHSGSEEAFVAVMNRRAKDLGMKNTNFTDASGYSPHSQTTVYDMALLSRELVRHEIIVSRASIWMYDLRGGETQLVNTNRLVRFFEGCIGLKTGVGEEGNAVSAVASKGEKKFIAVVMGTPKTDDSFEDAKTLLRYGFENFKVITPEIDLSLLHPVKVINGVCAETTPHLSETEMKVLIRAADESAVTVEVDLPSEVKAPVCRGQRLGVVRFMNGDRLLAERSIVAAENVDMMDFFHAFWIVLHRVLC